VPDTFIKTRADAPVGFFEAESAGLAWLADATGLGGVRVVRALRTAPGLIELERVHETRPTPGQADAFGTALAHTHSAGAAAFGSPPEGWAGPLFIGRRPMVSARQTRWGRFYSRDRVLPFVALAARAGSIDEREERVIRSACARIEAGDFDDAEPPARLHGDLWNGNVLWSADGAVLIDPAAHGGHRETDLAMLALFGLPNLERVLAAYESEAVAMGEPLRSGWRERVPVHQLHPLAVHAAGHGRGYGVALVEAAEATLALIP
jgi:fructosamine-3-kinase